MAAAAMLEKFQMAISPQQFTIYIYSAHRAVIFAIAQLSCYAYCRWCSVFTSEKQKSRTVRPLVSRRVDSVILVLLMCIAYY